MIPAIIYLLLRRYKRTNPAKAERLTLVMRKASRMLLLFILLTLIWYCAMPQDMQLQYSIKRDRYYIFLATEFRQ
jgi:hypothetical protein